MQTQKLDTSKIIIETARKEFLKNGFKGTSMRAIAKKSGVTLSNIYNYFRSKDEIFCVVLKPLLNAFDEILQEHNSEMYLTLDVFTIQSLQCKMIDDFFMVILKKYRPELKLLLFNASGSSLENYRDTFTDNQTETGTEYIRLMKKKYPHINANISDFFIHTLSSCGLTIIGEIITHDELSEKEVQEFLYNYITFTTAGWRKLMKA